jgi:hypothetical protein
MIIVVENVNTNKQTEFSAPYTFDEFLQAVEPLCYIEASKIA